MYKTDPKSKIRNAGELQAGGRFGFALRKHCEHEGMSSEDAMRIYNMAADVVGTKTHASCQAYKDALASAAKEILHGFKRDQNMPFKALREKSWSQFMSQ